MDLKDADMIAEARLQMQNIFDTFKRDEKIHVFKREDIVIISNDPYHNSDFSEIGEQNVQNNVVSREFNARIIYENEQKYERSFSGGEVINARMARTHGLVKIQVEEDAFNYIGGAESFSLFGEKYRKHEDVNRIGILGEIQFYQYVLMKDQ